MVKELDIEKRWAIVSLNKYAKWSQKRIASSLKCTQSGVSTTLKRYTKTGDIKNLRRSGRNRLISTTDPYQNIITKCIEKDRQITASGIADAIFKKLNIKISSSTIRRLRFELNYKQVLYRICPLLTAKSKVKRLTYALKHKRNNWNNVIFSDEKIFTLNNAGRKVWKRSDEKPIVIHQPLKPIQLMVWGGVWKNGRTSIHITDDIIDGLEYSNIVFEHMIQPNFDKGKLLQQDNARSHVSKDTLEFLSAMGVKVLKDYPPYSPELNPIEKVWSWMSTDVYKNRPKTKEALMNAIQKSWNELPQDIIKKYIFHLHTVCDKIILSKGESILE